MFKLLFPQLIWEFPSENKNIYLTFDDGPHPEITEEVLRILDQHKAKATFFCVGDNVKKYGETYHQIIKKGYLTGNHTFNHLNGWKTPAGEYYSNIEKCAQLVDSHLFRPPYGRIKPTQAAYLKMRYRIIMWTVLSYDFNQNLLPENCLQTSVRKTRPGSIVVFHDSEKAKRNMLYVLPRFLDHFLKLGYRFPVIPD